MRKYLIGTLGAAALAIGAFAPAASAGPLPPGVQVVILPNGLVDACVASTNGTLGGCALISPVAPPRELATYLQMGPVSANCTATAAAGSYFHPSCLTVAAVPANSVRTYVARTNAVAGLVAHGGLYSYLYANGQFYLVADSTCNAIGLIAGCGTSGSVRIVNEDPLTSFQFFGGHYWSANGGRLPTLNGHIDSFAS